MWSGLAGGLDRVNGKPSQLHTQLAPKHVETRSPMGWELAPDQISQGQSLEYDRRWNLFLLPPMFHFKQPRRTSGQTNQILASMVVNVKKSNSCQETAVVSIMCVPSKGTRPAHHQPLHPWLNESFQDHDQSFGRLDMNPGVKTPQRPMKQTRQ